MARTVDGLLAAIADTPHAVDARECFNYFRKVKRAQLEGGLLPMFPSPTAVRG